MFKQLAVVFTLLVGASVYLKFSVTKGKVVETKSGPVRAIVSQSRDGRAFNEWLGIPYAKPPVGSLRFASPVPADAWTGVLDGSNYGYRCVQLEFLTLFTVGNEDCLTLNIHAPEQSQSGPLPVMVYIHGGAYNNMASQDYQPDFFMDEDIILVVINYRLGLFGFMNTGDESIRGNMGLKDQALAIKWVKDNIEFFGGNPNQITIFGESAGGGSVHYQLLSPSTNGLFQRAISQSGVASNPWGIDSTEVAKSRTTKLAKKLKCPVKDTKKLVKCLRSRSYEQLISAVANDVMTLNHVCPHMNGSLFRPSVEAINDSETFLAQHPLDIVEKGLAHRVPWMTGVTSEEGIVSSSCYYANPESMEIYESNWEENTLRIFGLPAHYPNSTEITNAIRDFYLPANLTTDLDTKLLRLTHMFSDSQFNFHMHHSINKQINFSPVYPYFLSRLGGFSLGLVYISIHKRGNRTVRMRAVTTVGNLVRNGFKDIFLGRPLPMKGVPHGDDIIAQFPFPLVSEISKNKADDLRFSKDMVKLWVSFAKNESLNFRGVEFPPSVSGGPAKYLDLADLPQMVEEPPFLHRLRFLDSLNMLHRY